MRIEALSYWYAFAGPGLALWLVLHLLVSKCRLPSRRWPSFLVLGLVSFGLLTVPVGGLPLGRWVYGLNVSLSVPLAGVLVGLLLKRAFGQELFRPHDLRAVWLFGAIAGLLLYPFALGWGDFDPYPLGWGFRLEAVQETAVPEIGARLAVARYEANPLFILSAALTGWLLWRQNRFGLLLLGGIVAYHLGLLESTNYWDYLVDPVYFGVSVFMVVRRFRPRARSGNLR